MKALSIFITKADHNRLQIALCFAQKWLDLNMPPCVKKTKQGEQTVFKIGFKSLFLSQSTVPIQETKSGRQIEKYTKKAY